MKRLLFGLIILFTFSLYPQSAVTANTTTKSYIFSQNDLLQAVTYHIAFTQDSLLDQASPVLMDINECINTDFNTYPITYRIKEVSTYGTPRSDIYLQGLFSSVTDTITIDTLRATAVNQTQKDTIGTLNCNGYRPAWGYKIYIRVRTADVNSGVIDITFPVSPAMQIKKTVHDYQNLVVK